MTAFSRTSVGLLGFGTMKALGVVGALFNIAGGLLYVLLSLFLPVEHTLYITLLSLVPILVGVFLILISLNYFSKLYGNPSIYTNYLYSLVFYILSYVVGGYAILQLLSLYLPAGGGVAEWQDPGALAAQALTTFFYAFLSFLFAALLYLLSTFFYYRALTFMAASSQVELFRYAGLSGLVGGGLMFLGTLLLIILIGVLFIILSYLAQFASVFLLLVAFLEIKEPQPSPPAQPMAPAAPA